MKRISIINSNEFTTVDSYDYVKLAKYNWCLSKGRKTNYAKTRMDVKGVSVCFRMHRVVMNVKRGQHVDHIDGNGLNNQKSNLRLCTNAQNCMNKQKYKGLSKYKGVYWCKDTGKWRARISCNYKTKHLGHFTNENDAGRAYNIAAEQMFGEFAKLNVIL